MSRSEDAPYRGTVIVIPDVPAARRPVEHIALLVILWLNAFIAGVLLS